MKASKTITAKEFDRLADEGGDLTPYLDWKKATRPNWGGKRKNAGRPRGERIEVRLRILKATLEKVETKARDSKMPRNEFIEKVLAES